MQKLLPTLLAIFFLAGCAPTSTESSAETASEENQTADNFERNLECQDQKENAREQISKITEGTTGTMIFDLEDIFYSSKRNSCLYIYGGCTEGMWCAKYLIDLFASGERLEEFSGSLSNDQEKYLQELSIFQEKIAEYQN